MEDLEKGTGKGHVFGSDPENGGTTGADANGSAKTDQKVTLPNNAVDETSLKNRRKVLRCISNKDCEKESKLLEEVKSILRNSSRADREKLCGEVDEEGKGSPPFRKVQFF